MSGVDVESILKEVDQLLVGGGALPAEAQEAVEKLLNVVESLRVYPDISCRFFWGYTAVAR